MILRGFWEALKNLLWKQRRNRHTPVSPLLEGIKKELMDILLIEETQKVLTLSDKMSYPPLSPLKRGDQVVC